MAREIGSIIVGVGVGFLTGSPQLGFLAGQVVYGLTAPNAKQQGPRLTDLKAPQSAYGAVIPYLEGAPRTAGIYVWSSAKREIATTSTQSGKGGPGVDSTLFTYEVDVLVLFSINELVGLRKVFSNGKLVWNASAEADDTTLRASDASNHWRKLRFYGGGAAQLPDPTYEAAVGIGNAPAYRGRGSVFIEGLNLGGSGQLPVLTFEVTTAGVASLYNTAVLSAPLTVDGADILAPAAALTTTFPALISFSALGATFSGPMTDVPVLKYDGVKLFPDYYNGKDLSFEVEVSFDSIIGSGTGGTIRFFTCTMPGLQAAFSHELRSGVLYIRTYTYPAGGPAVESTIGVAPANAKLRITFEANDTTVAYYLNDKIVWSTPLAKNANNSISLVRGNSGANGPAVLTFRNLKAYSGVAPFGITVVTAPAAPLDQVVSRMCLRTGLLTAADIDVTALAADSVRAMAVSQVSPIRQSIEVLMAAYLFEAVEGDKIKFVKRGGAPVLTIPYADLGASASGDAEPLPLRRLNDIELPARVTVKYANVSNDYQDGAESGDRLVSQSTAVAVVELPIGFTPAEAKRIADANTMDLAVSLIGIGPVSLTRKYPQLEPTDVVLLTGKDGSTFRARIQKDTRTAAGINSLELVLDDATIVNSAAATDSTYSSSTLVRSASATTLNMLDIPILRDADDAPGDYAAFGAADPWPGAVLYGSPDNITFTRVLDASNRAVMGVATTTLGAWAGGTVFDEINTLTVNVGTGQLASVTRDVLLSTASNALLVGSEIVQFRDALLVSAGVYTLTGLLRGRRGTEWAMVGHAAAERVVALGTTGLRRVPGQAADIGQLRHYKAVTIGKSLADVSSVPFTDTGVALKPFSPVDLRKSGTDSSVSVNWKRRTRHATRFCGSAGISAPLGEASESYFVELRDSVNALVSTQTVTIPQWVSSSSTVVGGLFVPCWGLETVSGELVGIRDDLFDSYSPRSFVRFSPSTGLLLAQSPTLGQSVAQWASNGDELYAAVANFNTGNGSYLNTKVQRVTRTALGTIAATYTSPFAGDLQGVACDGTSVWATEYYSGNLRKLNASTLASVATYVINVNISTLVHDAGNLWICRYFPGEIIVWNIATTAETLRFSVVEAPFDVLLVGSLVFVLGSNAVGVYNKTTGALVISLAISPPFLQPQRSLRLWGSYVAVANARTVMLLDSTTGALVRTLDPARTNFYAIAGSSGSTLYLTVGTPGNSLETVGYQLAAPALAGYTLTVYQQAASARGYPATLAL